MQPPPPQGPQGYPPQGPGNYPREPYGAPEKFTMDMVMGIILIILAALGICGSLALVGIGGFAGSLGASAGSREGAAVAAAGGLAIVWGLVLLATCIADIVGAAWMIKSLRKGFMLVLIVSLINLAISIIMGITGGGFNFMGLILGLVFPAYCAARVFGNFGPRPA